MIPALSFYIKGDTKTDISPSCRLDDVLPQNQAILWGAEGDIFGPDLWAQVDVMEGMGDHTFFLSTACLDHSLSLLR